MPRIIDLTLTLRDGMRGVTLETANTVAEHGWNARTLHLYSHCGTHVDAPLHFAAGDGAIDQIPLERCLASAWVVDLSGIAPRTLMTVEHLGATATRVQAGDGLLLKTGWSAHVANPTLYRDGFPRVSVELAEWCVSQQIKMLGVETPSVADVNNLDELTAVHKTLLAGNVVIVEGLTNLDQLREDKVLFVALPLKIAGGDGSPCRALAVEGALWMP
jgi:kynurenine formamidase